MRRVKLVVAGLFAVMMTSVLLAEYTEVAYSVAMPSAPDPATGRVHRLVVNHGHAVFVNDPELGYKRLTEHLMLLGICALALAGYLNVKYRAFPSPFSRRWRK
jgi:hypothetical protein